MTQPKPLNWTPAPGVGLTPTAAEPRQRTAQTQCGPGVYRFAPGDAVLESTSMAYDHTRTGRPPLRFAVSGPRAAWHFPRN